MRRVDFISIGANNITARVVIQHIAAHNSLSTNHHFDTTVVVVMDSVAVNMIPYTILDAIDKMTTHADTRANIAINLIVTEGIAIPTRNHPAGVFIVLSGTDIMLNEIINGAFFQFHTFVAIGLKVVVVYPVVGSNIGISSRIFAIAPLTALRARECAL